jgi:DnaJ like chaperone protein
MAKFLVLVIVFLFVYALISMMRKKSPGEKRGDGSSSQGPQGSAKPQDPQPSGGSGRKYGKWIGGGLGWAFGGPIGAILGFAMGSVLDGMKINAGVYRGTARGDFAMSLLVMSAAVMKADGKVVRSELDFVRSFFISQFGLTETERLIPLLQEILKQDINVIDVSVQVGRYMDYSSRLQLLHYLFGIASADGQYHASEVEVIETISMNMGILSSDFSSVRAMFIKDPTSAYKILEVTPDATDEEIKKAYRRLAVQYHPDKVAHLGEDIRKAATEKFQHLNAAYEEIRKQRGIK